MKPKMQYAFTNVEGYCSRGGYALISCSDDKNGDDATSASQVADMYRNQDQIKNQTGVKEEEDDDMEY